jgi:hypothetical protein
MADVPPPAATDLPAPAAARRPANTPAWLLALVAAAVVGGGVWGVRWLLDKPPAAVDLKQYASNDAPTGRFAPRPEGVTLNADGTGSVNTQDLSVRFMVANGRTNVTAAGRNGQRGQNDPADVQAVLAAQVAVRNVDRRKAAGVSVEQAKALAGIKIPGGPLLTEGTRAKLLDLWAKAQKASSADRPAVERDLVDLLKRTAKDNESRGADYKAAAAAVRAVLKPEQVAALRQQPPAASRPATRPATRPRPTPRQH